MFVVRIDCPLYYLVAVVAFQMFTRAMKKTLVGLYRGLYYPVI